MSSSNEPKSPQSSAVESFRGGAKRRAKLHPLELAALWVISAHLCFLPWALDGMHIWSQVISLALAVIGFAVALTPRNYTEEAVPQARGQRQEAKGVAFRLVMCPKLLKFPIFWIGLALLGYIMLQALNPAWEYQTNGKAWWMHRIDHKTWLPTGIIAPFEKWNQWRTLVVYSSAWLTVCAIWVGLTRRRSMHALLITLAVNGLGVAAFGIAQRLAGNGLMFWFFRSPNDSFFASFIYKNHAAAYLNLVLAVTCGLAGWYHSRARRRMERSNPSVVLVFFAMVISVSMVTSYARGATIVMVGFLSISIVAFAIHQFTAPKERRTPIIGITLILTFGFFLMTGLEAFKTREAWNRLKSGITREDRSLEFRVRVTAAPFEMLGENCSLWSSVTKLPRFEESKADATSQLADAQTSADR